MALSMCWSRTTLFLRETSGQNPILGEQPSALTGWVKRARQQKGEQVLQRTKLTGSKMVNKSCFPAFWENLSSLGDVWTFKSIQHTVGEETPAAFALAGNSICFMVLSLCSALSSLSRSTSLLSLRLPPKRSFTSYQECCACTFYSPYLLNFPSICSLTELKWWGDTAYLTFQDT